MNLLETRWPRFLDHLEERERRRARKLPGWRTQRHRRRLTVVLVAANLVMIAGAALAGRQGDLPFVPLFFMLSALLMLGLSVPTVVPGWTLPDDIPEESLA